MITQREKDIIIRTLDPYKPKKIGVFGSRVRSDHTDRSDLDLLVDLEHVNLLDLVELEQELSRLLDVKVDLVTDASLNKHLRPVIEKEIQYILKSEDDVIQNEK